MADTAFQTQYRQEMISGFEQGSSLLRETVTTEAVIKGNQATFIVVDSGGAKATTRGVNGNIVARADNLNQYTATLVEKHDLVKKTGFNIFASQGDQVKAMQDTSVKVINRAVDDQILAELATATRTTGAAATGSLQLVMKAKTLLSQSQVNMNDGNIYCVASPALMAYLMMNVPQFASRDYVSDQKFEGRGTMFRWLDINWIEDNNLPNLGTNQEVCYMYHKNAIAHAMDVKGMDVEVDYNKEQQYSWARSSFFGGAKLLQNSGVIAINHDGSAFNG